MVKVQKPQPKFLKKDHKVDGVLKDKQRGKKNVMPTKVKAMAATLVKDVNRITKNIEGKKLSEKIDTKVEVKTKSVKLPTKPKPSKKPLVLAPPESPAAALPKVSKKTEPISASKIVTELNSNKKAVEPKIKSKKLVSSTQNLKTQNKEPPLASGNEPNKQLQLKGGKQLSMKLKSNAVKQKGESNKQLKVTTKNVKQTKKNVQESSKKKEKKILELNYELKPFDEEKFKKIVSESNIKKVCEALKNQVVEEVKKRKTNIIFSDYRYILQVCCYKIPSCPKRIVKLALKHSLVGTNDDVAIIVTDLQRGARVDYEPTVQHYEDLFREAGIEQRLAIVPFNRLRNEMGSFEAKRKFLNTYDYLLCDGRISGQASAFLGNNTQKPRNVLHAVRLSKEEQIAKEISRALCRTAYRQLRKGDLTAIPVGNHEHSIQMLSENILLVVKQLQQHYPGGLANIRSLYLKIDMVGTSALPIYISMCAPPEDVPYVVGPREQRMLKLKKQANEVLTRFALTKDINFVKLTHEQVKRKAELREKRNMVNSADCKEIDNTDAENSLVPLKKARKNIVKTKPNEMNDQVKINDGDADEGEVEDINDDDEDED